MNAVATAVANILWVKEDDHSPLGPSSAERWINCPGSVAATRGIVDTGSDFALEGTAAHGLSEHCRKTNLSAQDFLGWTMRVQTGETYRDFPVTQEMVDAVTEYIDWVDEVIGDDLIEERVHYEEYVPKGFGKLDAARMFTLLDYGLGAGFVTDFKYGKGVQVFAKNHTQTKIYALGIYLKYNWLYGFRKFVLRIAQPRLDHMDEWEITVEDLLKWAEDVLKPAAARVLAGDTTRKAGDWCQFCKIRLTCETRAKSLMTELVGDEFEDLEEAVTKTETLTIDSLRDREHVATLLKAADRIVKFFKALKIYAMKELQQGNAVGDYKLVAGRAKRVYDVAEEVAVRRLIQAGLPEEKAYKTVAITPPQAETILGKEIFAPAKDATARKPAKPPGRLFGLVRKLDGKPTLAPGSDSRPALAHVDPSDFENLDEEEDFTD